MGYLYTLKIYLYKTLINFTREKYKFTAEKLFTYHPYQLIKVNVRNGEAN
jgi:hypothetical protein